METLFDENLFIIVHLLAEPDPAIQALAVPFEELENVDWWPTFKQEKGLIRGLFAADARGDRLDDTLDFLSDTTAAIVKLEVKSSGRPAALVRYYGSQRPSEFRKARLGPQLDAMRTWPPSLLASANATLQEVGAKIAATVKEADASITAELLAEQQLTDFRVSGARKALVDKFNALRKSTHGALAKFAHEHPEKNLPSSWADSFFRHESAPRVPTLEELERKITFAEAELTRLKVQRDQIVAAQDAEEKVRQDAERTATKAALSAAEEEAAEIAKKVAALKAELGEKDKKDEK